MYKGFENLSRLDYIIRYFLTNSNLLSALDYFQDMRQVIKFIMRYKGQVLKYDISF